MKQRPLDLELLHHLRGPSGGLGQGLQQGLQPQALQQGLQPPAGLPTNKLSFPRESSCVTPGCVFMTGTGEIQAGLPTIAETEEQQFIRAHR